MGDLVLHSCTNHNPYVTVSPPSLPYLEVINLSTRKNLEMWSEQSWVQLQLECNLVLMTLLHTKHTVGRNRTTTLSTKHYKSQFPKHCSVPGQQRPLVQLEHTALPTDIYPYPSLHLEGIPSEIWGEQSLQKAAFPSVPNKEPTNSD